MWPEGESPKSRDRSNLCVASPSGARWSPNAGAGPKPVPAKQLDSQKLADGIMYCLTTQARSAAQDIAEQMKSEQGVQAAVQSWLRQLSKHRLRCDVVHSEPAAWVYKKGKNPVKLLTVTKFVFSSGTYPLLYPPF